MAIQFRIQVKRTRKRKPATVLRKQFKKDVQNTLRKIGAIGVNNIRSEIKKRNLVKTGETYRSIHYKMTPQGVKFIAEGAMPYLEKGIRRHQMKYLMNSNIPVDVANSVFRWATPKSMGEGKWVHPGFKRGKGMMKSAIKRTRKSLTTELKAITGKVF
jgi:hypothetical protein